MYAKLTAQLRYISPRGNETTLREYKLFHRQTVEAQYYEEEEGQPDTTWVGKSGFVEAKFKLLRAVNKKTNYRTFV